MANRTGTNPIYVDQCNADVTLAGRGVTFIVKKIRLLSATQWDLFFLHDLEGNSLFRMENSLGNARMTEVDFGPEGFDFGNSKGVMIDVSLCTGWAGTDGTDAVWIYLK